MKSDLMKYVSGEKNAIKDEFIISRESLNGNEFVQVGHPELPEPLYEFVYVTDKRKHKTTPKHTGGKKPYVMIMLQELDYLMNKKEMLPEDVGYLICLTPYIEWGTGRLLCGREKRQMKFVDIQRVFGKKLRASQRIISKLKKIGLLAHGNGGYFISRNLIKRGGAKRED